MIFAAFGLAYITFVAPMAASVPRNYAPTRAAFVEQRAASSTLAEREADARAILRALNAARAANGLRTLALDPRLCSIARSHAFDMVERNYFDHISPDGDTPFDRMNRARIRFAYAGENLALDRSADAAEDALWHSSEHRSNMLEPHYARVGIAAVPSPDGEVFVEDFSD